tara:strand:- start:883 stop:1446 length:564 start_codon:yes stop_codon:yes gene_type:complete
MKKQLFVSFLARKTLIKKSGLVPIYCRVRYDKTNCTFNTNIDVSSSYWDSDRTRVIGKNKKSLNFKWVITNRKKTNTTCKIQLLPPAQEILEKYIDSENEKIFPMISNQKTNKALKKILKLCEINKNITFHCGRHTFGTIITLDDGVPIETLSKMLGHKSLKTTQIYAQVLDSKISSDMIKLRQNYI